MNEAAIEAVEELDNPIKTKLSVPLLAAFLNAGHSQSKIATTCNISRQAVNDYITRHYNELEPLVDTTDGLMAMQSKHIAVKAMNQLTKVLDMQPKRSDLVSLSTVAGTMIDKTLILQGKATQIVKYEDMGKELEELEAEIAEYEVVHSE